MCTGRIRSAEALNVAPKIVLNKLIPSDTFLASFSYSIEKINFCSIPAMVQCDR